MGSFKTYRQLAPQGEKGPVAVAQGTPKSAEVVSGKPYTHIQGTLSPPFGHAEGAELRYFEGLMKVHLTATLSLSCMTGIALPACNDTRVGESASETGEGEGTGDTGTSNDDAPCGGDPRAIDLGIEGPSQPGSYQTPNHAAVVYVETSTELLEALEQAPAGSHTDIVLRDGAFTTARVPQAQGGVALHGHRLWAQHPGKVTISFGFHAMGNDPLEAAAELHGIHFDVSDTRYVHESEADKHHRRLSYHFYLSSRSTVGWG